MNDLLVIDQGLLEVCLNTLCRTPLASMAIPDAFNKLREQIVVRGRPTTRIHTTD
jgi:hypothetical protein